MPLSHVHVIPLQLIVVLLASDLVLYDDEDAVLSVSQEDIDILVLPSYLDVFEVNEINGVVARNKKIDECCVPGPRGVMYGE